MLVQKVAPTKEDIESIFSTANAKGFMRIMGDEDNDIIYSMITSAFTEANERTNRNLVTATFELYLPSFRNEIPLPKNPVQEIVSVEYMDMDNNYVVLESANYYIYENLGVDTLVFSSHQSVPNHKKAVRITFKSGYKSTNFPEDLKSWIRVKVSTLYEYREEFIVGASIAKTTHVDSVLSRYKIRTFWWELEN